MASTFGGIEISKRGLFSHQIAIQTTGHNIANASNENYARQRVEFSTMPPLYEPSLTRMQAPGQLGQGSKIANIERIRNAFYDEQIFFTGNEKNYWETKFQYLYQMERIFKEPSENTLRTLLENFWSSWQDLSQYPSELSHRAVVIEKGKALVAAIKDTYTRLQNLQSQVEQEIIDTVRMINTYAKEIQELNIQILKSQILGDNPNDLLDKRDGFLEKLSALVDVRIQRTDKDEVIVYLGEQALVQGQIVRQIQTLTDAENYGFSKLVWDQSNKDVIVKGGKLLSLLELRDKTIPARMLALDEFTINLADTVNEIHRDGFGLDGSTNIDFFTFRELAKSQNGEFRLPEHKADFDFDNNGIFEITSVFRVTGTQKVDPKKQLGISGTLTFLKWNSDTKSFDTINISYSEEETLEGVVNKINHAKAGIVAYINHDNRLTLKAARDQEDTEYNFFIKHIEDSGDLLVGYTGVLKASGIAGAFDFRRTGEIRKFQVPLENITLSPLFRTSLHIEVNEVLQRDISKIAAARGKDWIGAGDYHSPNGSGDGENALLIAGALKQRTVQVGYAKTFLEFHTALLSGLGSESRKSEDMMKLHSDHLTHLKNLRQSVMGVNLDEEMANLIQFQHAYNASAKVLRTLDELLDVIINRLKP